MVSPELRIVPNSCKKLDITRVIDIDDKRYTLAIGGNIYQAKAKIPPIAVSDIGFADLALEYSMKHNRTLELMEKFNDAIE